MTLGIEAKEDSLLQLKDCYTHLPLSQAIAGLIRRYRSTKVGQIMWI